MRETESPPSWLFVREQQTVYVFQLSPEELAICGPASRRSTMRFHSEQELFRFRQINANKLLGAGYGFAGYCVDRRSGAERRQTPRPEGDRRGV